MFKTIDWQGKLAITLGFSPDWADPQESRTVWVSPVLVGDAPDLVGLERGTATGNSVLFWRPDAVPVKFECDHWQQVVESRPVPKPRRRGAWGWWGGWHRL